MHAFERAMEATTLGVARSVAGQQAHDAWVAVVVERVFQHPQLQQTVGQFLLAAVAFVAVHQMHLDAGVLHPIPELAHLRRHGTRGHRLGQRPVGVASRNKLSKWMRTR